ncbi:MAG: endonuclease III [Gemmatimonadaceae bacterium]|nr:endonuclease III [Gemmatimonadaceae bacterium]
MAKRGGGKPRQPLSQRRPGKAAARGTPKGPSATSRPRTKASAARKTATAARPSPSQSRRLAHPGRVPARGDDAARRRHAEAVWNHLAALYPDAHCELDFRSPWELLVATILSAQCTDKRVNMVTPVLFERWPSPAALAAAEASALEGVIKSTGFFRAKTRALLGVAAAVTDVHGGAVPSRMEDLVVLPGVGRKTANVVLGNAFGVNEGVVVDTHVGRLAVRLGLTSETDPVKVEAALMALFDRERWTLLSHLLIWHGRRVCEARKPRCGDCRLNAICPASLA